MVTTLPVVRLLCLVGKSCTLTASKFAVAALVAGLATAFVASQLRAVFFDARTLRDIVGLPLLGVVTLVISDSSRHKEKSDLRRFVAASSGLAGVFILGIIILTFVSGRL